MVNITCCNQISFVILIKMVWEIDLFGKGYRTIVSLNNTLEMIRL